MKFNIKNQAKGNLAALMRRVGYYFLDERNSEFSFVRPFEKSGYPRFHLYIKNDEKNNKIIFNLHLDQKRPIYKGTPAHAGEYKGLIVEKEIERIKQTLD